MPGDRVPIVGVEPGSASVGPAHEAAPWTQLMHISRAMTACPLPTTEWLRRTSSASSSAWFEHIPGIVAYMDLVQLDNPGSSIPLYISPQIEDLLGYPRDAWLTDDELWLDVLHPEDAERMIAAD